MDIYLYTANVQCHVHVHAYMYICMYIINATWQPTAVDCKQMAWATTCSYISQFTRSVDRLYTSLVSGPSEGEGEGRPGTHCMLMRHHSPDFGESDLYVWIYCLYTLKDAFTVKDTKNAELVLAVSTRPSFSFPLRRPSCLGTRLTVYHMLLHEPVPCENVTLFSCNLKYIVEDYTYSTVTTVGL